MSIPEIEEIPGPDPIGSYFKACRGFDAAVESVGDKAQALSPCAGWTAAAVIEHVTLVHRAVAAALGRDLDRRCPWDAARDAVSEGLVLDGVRDQAVRLPWLGMGGVPLAGFVPVLTMETLVHTWDVARAVGADETLDPFLCVEVYERVVKLEANLRAGDQFGPRVPVPDGVNAQVRLLAFLGRNPLSSD